MVNPEDAPEQSAAFPAPQLTEATAPGSSYMALNWTDAPGQTVVSSGVVSNDAPTIWTES